MKDEMMQLTGDCLNCYTQIDRLV